MKEEKPPRDASWTASWNAAQRLEEWAGEARVNLFRIAAITTFYLYHLIYYFAFDTDPSPRFHLIATGIAMAWGAAAVAFHLALAARWSPPYLKFGALAGDVLLATALLLASGGPRSPFLVLHFLIIGTAALRLDLRAVWAASAMALASYVVLCGHALWVVAETRVPRSQEVIYALGLIGAGVLAGQSVRQARRLARDYAERQAPAGPS